MADLNALWQEYQATKQPDINALWSEYQNQQPAETPQAPIQAEEPSFLSRFGRASGQIGRNLAVGVGGIGDLGRIALNPVYKAVGADEMANEPMPSQTIQNFIDRQTNNQLQPQGMGERFAEQATQFAGNALSMNPLAAGSAALRPLATKTGGELASLLGASAGLQGAEELNLPAPAQLGLSVLGAKAAAPLAKAGALGTAKAVTPAVDEGLAETVKLAKQYKIPVSLDQVSGSTALKNVQKVSQELPFSGQKAFREKQLSAWNAQILKSVGSVGNKFTPAIMDNAFTRVGKMFDDFGRNKVFDLKENFEPQVQKILDDASQTSSADSVNNFQNAVAKIRDNAKGANGAITGEKLNAQRAEVNRLARKTENPETKSLLRDLENAIIETMAPEGSAANKSLQDAKYKYKNLLVIEPLTQKAKAGNISPSQLSTRVAKIYDRAYTRGKAGDLGNLAKIGQDLLPELGGSDTMQKQVYAGALGALGVGGYLAPVATGLAALKALPALGLNRAYQAGFNRNPALIDEALLKGAK